jgi:glucans biosynthesis protein C
VKPTAVQRRYELDWLRAGLVIGAMVYHVIYEAQVYFPDVRVYVFTQLVPTFANQCGLPLLFLIAGASAWLSLMHRTERQFITERVLHLLVPFVCFVLTTLPLTNYFATLIGPGPHLSFAQYYVHFFRGYSQFFHGDPLDYVIAAFGILWFILAIFLLSIVVSPLIVGLQSPRGERVIAGFAAVCRIPGSILLFGLLFVLCYWLLGISLPAAAAVSPWLAALYVLSFTGGIFLYADPSIERAVYRDSPVTLLLGTLCFASVQILVMAHALPPPHGAGYVCSALLEGSFPWFGALGFLGLGKRLLNFTNVLLVYLKEAVYPYFLLHLLFLNFFGYAILEHSHWLGVVQGMAIIACTVASVLLLYEYVIRRSALLRVIFGMKPRLGALPAGALGTLALRRAAVPTRRIYRATGWWLLSSAPFVLGIRRCGGYLRRLSVH